MLMTSDPLIRNVSDTALWVAVYRAQESERPDALFHDPYAQRLAGERGVQIVEALSSGGRMSWPMVTRTWLLDRLIEEALAAGADAVVNLAAGLDTRPYRMKLTPELPWIEVDLPGILDYKEKILGDAKPACRLERTACDLSDTSARRELFAALGKRFKNALVLTEGLLVYLPSDEVASLAQNLSAAPFMRWAFDLQSPVLLKMLQKEFGDHLAQAPMLFGPPDGPSFFEPFGWRLVYSRSFFKTAGKLGRLPFFMSLLAMLPERKRPWEGRVPWAGICLVEKR
jgi:methyltransferase (TIGR00027 family)